MNKNSVSKNYVYNLIYQILLIFLPLITTPYVSRVLGAENIGIYRIYSIYCYVFYFVWIFRNINVCSERNCLCTRYYKR
ncbi:polysaccharide biosynthesis protein [Clostridium sp. CAG:571]|jgi:O-antigen/teichoic acid export membrane protein|nr:polysaccharide biosynthesis protein [Clostridium sp. CAG:571]